MCTTSERCKLYYKTFQNIDTHLRKGFAKLWQRFVENCQKLCHDLFENFDIDLSKTLKQLAMPCGTERLEDEIIFIDLLIKWTETLKLQHLKAVNKKDKQLKIV